MFTWDWMNYTIWDELWIFMNMIFWKEKKNEVRFFLNEMLIFVIINVEEACRVDKDVYDCENLDFNEIWKK